MIISFDNVSKYYGPAENIIPAIDRASFKIEKGEFVIITGASGSGKTTLLNLMGGTTFPDGGEIMVTGKNPALIRDRELSGFRAVTIGFIFQFQSMITSLNVIDNILLPSVFSAAGGERKRAEIILGRVGLRDRMRSFSNELSIGQQRRVCIARAILNRPAILLCDEPAGDLDAENEALIMDIIREENRNGAAVVMATHNLNLKSSAARSFEMKDGRIS